MRITIEHEGRVVQYEFQDGAVAEVSMHDFTFTITGVHLWSKVDCLAEWALDLREEEA